jgi:hypothetical protein
MGEYIQLDGRPYKIGTCESLYYVRYTDLADWIAAGRAQRDPGNADPAVYLNGAHRFRFPFPDEDGAETTRLAAYVQSYERGLTVRADSALLEGVAHLDVDKWLRPGELDHGGCNVYLPCPYDTEAFDHLRHSPVGDARFVSIVQQRPFDGCLWTVVRCPFCGALWRLTSDQAQVLAGNIRADQQHDARYAELARRIIAGYETPTGAIDR